jgi:hypothetical protein
MTDDNPNALTQAWRPTMPNVPANHPWQVDKPIPFRYTPNSNVTPRKFDRKRLDLRVSMEMQAQLNDLCIRLQINATEAIRQAIAALHTQHCGTGSIEAPPQVVKALPARAVKELRDLDNLIEQTEREAWGR